MEGSGKMVVTAVGMNSQAGIIVALLGATTHELDNAATAADSAGKNTSHLSLRVRSIPFYVVYTLYTLRRCAMHHLNDCSHSSLGLSIKQSIQCVSVFVFDLWSAGHLFSCTLPLGHFL